MHVGVLYPTGTTSTLDRFNSMAKADAIRSLGAIQSSTTRGRQRFILRSRGTLQAGVAQLLAPDRLAMVFDLWG